MMAVPRHTKLKAVNRKQIRAQDEQIVRIVHSAATEQRHRDKQKINSRRRPDEQIVRIARSAEAEQRHRVVAPDLAAVGFGDIGGVEPRGSLRVILERIIDRKQQPVGADCEDGLDQ